MLTAIKQQILSDLEGLDVGISYFKADRQFSTDEIQEHAAKLEEIVSKILQTVKQSPYLERMP